MNRMGRNLILCLVTVALAAVCTTNEAHAQSFSFGISSGHGHGHHHHHYRHHWHDHCYDPWFGLYYAPAPIVRERVVYVQPERTKTIIVPSAPAASTSSTPTNSLASTPVATASDARITIRNAAGVKLPVSFLVDGKDTELGDGAAQSFVGKDRITVQYDRGGHFGSTQHELTEGNYDFRITASGWDLVRRPTTLDRTAVRPNSLPSAEDR